MNQKELTKTFMRVSNWKKNLGLHGLYKIIQSCKSEGLHGRKETFCLRSQCWRLSKSSDVTEISAMIISIWQQTLSSAFWQPGLRPTFDFTIFWSVLKTEQLRGGEEERASTLWLQPSVTTTSTAFCQHRIGRHFNLQGEGCNIF